MSFLSSSNMPKPFLLKDILRVLEDEGFFFISQKGV